MCIGGGNFLTQSAPTYFHQFFIRKVLTPNERIDDFMEVTPAQRDALEAVDATFVEPPHSFIDQWNAACGTYGTYNYQTGYFELNGLTDITYEQAVVILSAYENSPLLSTNYYQNFVARTQIPRPIFGPIALSQVFRGSSVTHARLLNSSTNLLLFGNSLGPYMFSGNILNPAKIVKWLDTVDIFGSDNTTYRVTISCFVDAPYLEYFRIKNVNADFELPTSSKIGVDSLQYVVNNRYPLNSPNAQPFTVTVHADVYAKLTGDTTNAATAALTPDELAQWMALVETATEKNITFATA